MSKKYKRIFSALLSFYILIIMVCTSTFIKTYAIPGNDPRIYVDIVYQEDGNIRADVIFENMPNIKSGGFHIGVGAGWSIVPSLHGRVDGIRIDMDDTLNGSSKSVAIDGNGRFIAFLNTESDGMDYNGVFCHFFIERTNINTPINSVINCYLGNTGYICTSENINYRELPNNPVMLSSHEYLIGDADGNGVIDATDATDVLTATANNMMHNVYSIRNTFTNIFPNAVCAASPDANEDGVINSADAFLILDAYATSSVENNNMPICNVGKIAIYELFS